MRVQTFLGVTDVTLRAPTYHDGDPLLPGPQVVVSDDELVFDESLVADEVLHVGWGWKPDAEGTTWPDRQYRYLRIGDVLVLGETAWVMVSEPCFAWRWERLETDTLRASLEAGSGLIRQRSGPGITGVAPSASQVNSTAPSRGAEPV